MMKRTKILATYGPSIDTISKVKQLINAGVNAFRVNCSHGGSDDFIKAASLIRQASSKSIYPIGLLFDISGPKLRLERFDGEIEIKTGQNITITTGLTDLSKNIVGVNHSAIISSVKKGERFLIDDGNISFEIISISKENVKAKALNDGKLLPGKGINLPDSDIRIPTITAKDKRDIKTAVEVGADFVALSFVRSGDDIIEARKLIKKYGGHQKIIAKLEKKEAIDLLDEIMLLADGVMVARGDLGVELPPEELPSLQKRIIALANRHHRPVIVATQMLESMRFSPRATRAEINDVASAVFDKADAVMLSAETATGQYPLEAVKVMAGTIKAAEVGEEHTLAEIDEHLIKAPIPYTIAGAVSDSDRFCSTKVIFAFTTSGYTAALISNLFPKQPIMALSPDTNVLNYLTLYRSVYSVSIIQPSSFEDMLDNVNNIIRKHKLGIKGERVIVTGGAPFGSNAPTNFMLIHEVP